MNQASTHPIVVQRQVDEFEHKFGQDALHLAYHASLPVALNTELLHLLRVNFFLDPPGPLPYTTESDLLLSNLCHEIGEDLYEIESATRDALLKGLVAEYGYERMRQVAALLWEYTDRRMPWGDRIRLDRAQRLTALNFLDPEKAKRWCLHVDEHLEPFAVEEREWFIAALKEIEREARLRQQTDGLPSLAVAGRDAHLFIAYKRHADPDQKLASYLNEFFTAEGHDVFIDTSLHTGSAWLEEIDRELKSSDFLIVLLSKDSADSEMIKAEVRRAYEYCKLQGHPHTLPVRMAYKGLLPYSIDAFLDPLQYVVWENGKDNEHVAHEILAAIEGRLPEQEPVQLRRASGELTISEDGRPVADGQMMHPPLPEFDPRFLEELEAPGGAVKLRSKFYVEREADARLKREVVKSGTTTTIRAARQTGKSSLLVRGVHYARERGAKLVTLDMQRVDPGHLEMPDVFLHYLAECIVRRLRLDLGEVEKIWRSSLGPQDKLTYLMEDYVLPSCDGQMVLALDEVDRLLMTPLHNGFFGLLRSWHNSRALDDQWNKLNIAMVISTEPYLLIADVSQSPFNVGLSLYLQDFDESQIRDLNKRHGSPVGESDISQLVQLLSGHPYLTRKALYTLVTRRMTWLDLVRAAPSDGGPFGDHLRRYHWLLRDEPDLREALNQVIHHSRCADDMAFFRLLRAGLVKGSGDVCKCRCGLYRMYFEDKL